MTRYAWGGAMATDYQRRPITAHEFFRMAEADIFGPNERLELLEGEIIVKPPVNPPHFGSVARLNRLLVMRLGERAIVVPQSFIVLSKYDAPAPDFSILLPRDDFYSSARAAAPDIYALIECADSSLSYDRGKKLRVYAQCGVAEYWIVNIRGRQIEIHRNPHDLGYTDRLIAKPGENVTFAAIPEVEFAVDELLGPALEFKGDDA